MLLDSVLRSRINMQIWIIFSYIRTNWAALVLTGQKGGGCCTCPHPDLCPNSNRLQLICGQFQLSLSFTLKLLNCPVLLLNGESNPSAGVSLLIELLQFLSEALRSSNDWTTSPLVLISLWFMGTNTLNQWHLTTTSLVIHNNPHRSYQHCSNHLTTYTYWDESELLLLPGLTEMDKRETAGSHPHWGSAENTEEPRNTTLWFCVWV